MREKVIRISVIILSILLIGSIVFLIIRIKKNNDAIDYEIQNLQLANKQKTDSLNTLAFKADSLQNLINQYEKNLRLAELNIIKINSKYEKIVSKLGSISIDDQLDYFKSSISSSQQTPSFFIR